MGVAVLRKIRLTWLFLFVFIAYVLIVMVLPTQQFESAALTLFSVNSFLYGFYIAPILGAQKARIEEMHKIVRNEANAIFSILIHTKNLPAHLRNQIQEMFEEYVRATVAGKGLTEGERRYEFIITFFLTYKGAHKEATDKLLESVIANQQNRTLLNMHLRNKVYSNEWMIMLVLFSITLGFILLLDVGSTPVLLVIKALLCTGLTMLIVILMKLSTLTHKKATEIWRPLQKLLGSRFYRID